MLRNYHKQRLLSRIEKASETELNEVISKVIQLYSTKYPDQEIMFLSLPKNDPQERKRTLDTMYRILSQQP